ncbi:hypothetical protein IGI04_040330 [Brassica rapa subsp. trilocularis]|uniref:Uncharacterized protein n=1 Tax=Brassica rapa subsp. trilocularis TaxID=1813537 RepID=A0ABQ7KR32_BRACM|nr:hypothetical protein IGI04_040330 [Brassica rapa subsp. trilocularis]
MVDHEFGFFASFSQTSLSYRVASFNYLLEFFSLCLSSSSNRCPGVRHSTFESLRLSRSSQSIASGFLRFWDSLNFKKDREFVGIMVLFLNFVIHGITPDRRANYYMPSLKAYSIVKVDRFEVARCSSMYKITDHPFLIRFISLTIIYEVITSAPEINLQSRLDNVVGQIRYVQDSDLTKETTRVVIHLLIDPYKKQSTHNSLYITVYIVLTSIIINISYPRFVVNKLQTLINTNNNDICLYIIHQIKEKQTQPHQEIRDNLNGHKNSNNISTCSLLLSYENNLHAKCQ